MQNRCSSQNKNNDKLLKSFLSTCDLIKINTNILVERNGQTTTYNAGTFVLTERIGSLTSYIELKSDSIVGQVNTSLNEILYDISDLDLTNFIKNYL